MTLYDRLKSDNQRILGGDDMQSLTLYDASGTSYDARGRITAPGMDFSPQGQPFASKKWTIAFHISDFSTIVGDDENFKGWQGEFLNSEGETIQGRFNNQLVDKTFGYVVCTLTQNHSGVTL